MMALGGALVIGSLFWDTDNGRSSWWDECLDRSRTYKVRVPIRYGRYSSSKRRCYTMTYSPSLSISEWGCGYVISLCNFVRTKNDLLHHASRMGRAEGGNVDLVTNWVSVALVTNPQSAYKEELEDLWMTIFSKREVPSILLKHYHGDPSPIDSQSIMRPLNKDIFQTNSNLAHFDFLLATSTRPKHKDESIERYPTPKEIAHELIGKGPDNYFNINNRNGITTYQDDEILNLVDNSNTCV